MFCDSEEQEYPWDWKSAKRNNPTLQRHWYKSKVKKAEKNLQIPAVFKIYFWSIWKNTRVRLSVSVDTEITTANLTASWALIVAPFFAALEVSCTSIYMSYYQITKALNKQSTVV